MLEIPRRQLITGLISLIAAPAIVRISSIMPVKNMMDFQPRFICHACYNLFESERQAHGTLCEGWVCPYD